MKITILFENQHLIIAEKPQNMPTQADPTGDLDLFTYMKDYVSNKVNSKESNYVALHHRLDRPVGGVVAFSRSKLGNLSLSNQLKNHTLKKEYLAIVHGEPTLKKDSLTNHIKKLGTRNISKVVNSSAYGAKLAILHYHVIKTIFTEELGVISLLHIELETGRHHQIRVQLSNAGFPILGDDKYTRSKQKTSKIENIALWAYKLTLENPETKTNFSVISSPFKSEVFKLFDDLNLDEL